MSEDLRFYIPFGEGSIEKRADGSLMVKGTATSERLDSQGDIVDYGATVDAYNRVYKSRGSIREMHQSHSAAGVATQFDFDDVAKKVSVTSLIVDPIAIKKIEAGVYKGYSIGGRVRETKTEMTKGEDGAEKTARRIMKYDWTETSLVDQGANGDSNDLMPIVKAAAPDDEDEKDGGADEDKEKDGKKPNPFAAKKLETADIIAALAKMSPEEQAAVLDKAKAPIDRAAVEQMIDAATAPLLTKIDSLTTELGTVRDHGGALAKLDISTLAKVDALEAVDARLKKIEAQPASNGPAKAVLYPMAKGQTADDDVIAKAKDRDTELLEKMAATNDPNVREALMRERALLSFKTGI